jgi:hypothetical protein
MNLKIILLLGLILISGACSSELSRPEFQRIYTQSISTPNLGSYGIPNPAWLYIGSDLNFDYLIHRTSSIQATPNEKIYRIAIREIYIETRFERTRQKSQWHDLQVILENEKIKGLYFY